MTLKNNLKVISCLDVLNCHLRCLFEICHLKRSRGWKNYITFKIKSAINVWLLRSTWTWTCVTWSTQGMQHLYPPPSTHPFVSHPGQPNLWSTVHRPMARCQFNYHRSQLLTAHNCRITQNLWAFGKCIRIFGGDDGTARGDHRLMQKKRASAFNRTECSPVIVIPCLNKICHYHPFTEGTVKGKTDVYKDSILQLLYILFKHRASSPRHHWALDPSASDLPTLCRMGSRTDTGGQSNNHTSQWHTQGVEVRAPWGLFKFILTKLHCLHWWRHFFMELS